MLAAALAALVGCAAAADQTHYTVLDVARTASPAEIKRSYYRLAKGVHPDRLSSSAPADERAAMAERFKRVAEAYTVLSDKSSRAAYDAALARGAAATMRAARPPAQRPPAQRPPVARPPPSPGRGFGASGVARVDDLESLLAVGNASAAGILRRHVLLAVGDGRAPACARSLANAKFPFPFAGMTQVMRAPIRAHGATLHGPWIRRRRSGTGSRGNRYLSPRRMTPRPRSAPACPSRRFYGSAARRAP